MSSAKGPTGSVEKPANKEEASKPDNVPPATPPSNIPPVAVPLAAVAVPLAATATAADAPVTVPNTTGARVSVGINSSVGAPLAATLTAAGSPVPLTTPDAKSPAIGSGGSAGVLSASDLQALAQTGYATKYNLRIALGQGELKKILPFENGLALAVTLNGGSKPKEQLEKELNNLIFLKSLGFPAVQTVSKVFQINDKSAYVMEAIPEHTFFDGKNPGTIKTILPATLINVKIPNNEAWIFKKSEIEADIAQKLADPTSPTTAKTKAEKLYIQLQQIQKLLNTPDKEGKYLTIVDLQLLVDKAGNITIIDPLEVLKRDSKGQYFKLNNEKTQTTPEFEASIERARGLLADMQSYCLKIIKTSDPNELIDLITPTLPGVKAPANTAVDTAPNSQPLRVKGASSRARAVVFNSDAPSMGGGSGSGSLGTGRVLGLGKGTNASAVPPKALSIKGGPLGAARAAALGFSSANPASKANTAATNNATAAAGSAQPTIDASASAGAKPAVDASAPTATGAATDASKPPEPPTPAKKPGPTSSH